MTNQRMRECRSIVGVTWEWEGEEATRCQLLWETDTGAMRMGIWTAHSGMWFNTSCTLANGDVRRYTKLKDARAWAHSFLEPTDDMGEDINGD